MLTMRMVAVVIVFVGVIVIGRMFVLVFDGSRPLKPQEVPMGAPVRMKMDVAAVTVKYSCAHLKTVAARIKTVAGGLWSLE